MGRLQADEMARLTDLDTALAWHLRYNHYPPVPSMMLDCCKLAIRAIQEEDWDREIELPKGVSYKGHATAPARAIVEQHHLESFIKREE
jgi:hypothetical protein